MRPAKQPSRHERALRWRREQVLDAAEAVFAAKGFHQATMQEIARTAEYATGTLYTLFANKDALFAAVVERRLPQIAEYLQTATASGTTPRDQIERFVGAFFDFFGARKELFQIYLHVTGGFLWNVKAELGEHVHENLLGRLAHLEGVFRTGVRRGEFRTTLDARLAAVSLIGVLTASVTDWIAHSPDKPFAVLRPGVEEILRGLYVLPTRRSAASPRVPRRKPS